LKVMPVPVPGTGTMYVKDWRNHKTLIINVCFAAILLVLTTLVVVAFYLNHPQPEPLADSWSYLYVVDRILRYHQVANFWRLPGYPLFIVFVYKLTEEGNLGAVSVAQAVLFVLATLEIYVLALLVLRHIWMALLIGLLVGTNLVLLSFVKPIMSEALALWLLVSLALAVVVFLRTLRISMLWVVTFFTLLLFMTRPEWIYLPVPLAACLLLVAFGRKALRRLLPHMLAALVLLYAVLGGYIYLNATQNHFVGVTWIENINELGKVLQYNMQDEAPPQYAWISRTLDSFTTKGNRDPYVILAAESPLERDDAALAGDFARTIILHHPAEFLVKSIPIFFSSLTVFHDESRVAPNGPFGSVLKYLFSQYQALYAWNFFFLPCAAAWLLLLCWRRMRKQLIVQAMGVIICLSLYGLIIVSLGAYRTYDYMRIFTLIDPLMMLVIWGTFLAAAQLIVEHGPGVLVSVTGRYLHRQSLSISTGMLLLAALSGIGLVLFILRLFYAPGLSNFIGILFFLGMSAASLLRYLRRFVYAKGNPCGSPGKERERDVPV
jgi:hypothetical protein